MSDYAPPAPLPTFVRYAVVDRRVEPLDPLAFARSRSDARALIEAHPDREHLRIRRARVQLYQS